MPFLRFCHRARIPALLAAVLLMIRAASALDQDDRNDLEPRIVIPGGFPAIARLAGLNDSMDRSAGLERIFRSVLDSEPPAGSLAYVNQIRINLISYLDEYSQFLRYLEKESLAPSGLDPQNAREVRMPLTGDTKIEATRKVLSFFGIANRADNGTIALEEDRRVSKHKILYDALQVQIEDSSKELRIPLQSEQLPMILDGPRWTKILGGESSQLLFERFLKYPDAMRLYVALAGCTPSAREQLADSVKAAQLFKMSSTLELFGPDLRFEKGMLIFPGSRQAWAALPGSQDGSVEALLSSGGVPLLLYSALSTAPAPVQQYLTGSAGQFQSYLGVLKPYGGNAPGTVAKSAGQDLARLFRQLSVDGNGLTLDLGRLSHPLLHWIAPEQVQAGGTGPVPMTPKLLAKILPTPGVSPYSELSRVDTIEFFRYMEEVQPASLSAESIKSLLKAPVQAPVFLDLIGDLTPDAALLSRYLDYCSKIREAGLDRWNVNRTRTSQSIFYLLSALRREGIFSAEESNTLLREALDAFDSEDESAFSLKTAEFLSAKLLPQIQSPGRQDSLLAALSGNQHPHRILYSGRELYLNLSDQRYRRMERVLASQAYTPMPVLLDICTLLRRMQAGNDSHPDETMRSLSERLNEIRTAEWTPGDLKKWRGPVAKIELDSIKQKLESAGTNPDLRARQIAAEIHTELSVTLLAYCYAYSAMPDITVLSFDPNFVRKHRFYRSNYGDKPVWEHSSFVQEEATGGFVEGSLAGLGFELTRLRLAQSNQDPGISSNIELAPAILWGTREIRPALRTDRSQEYVALATHLGSALVSLPAADAPAASLIQETLAPLLSPQRLEQLQNRKAGVLSPSELFLLGQAYFKSNEWESGKCPDASLCLVAGKIKEIVPLQGTVDYNAFQDEVNQYGASLRSRTGLSRFSFDRVDSYERLERSLRPQFLYDRMCDLKIRIAELNYSLGLPASLGEIEADQALNRILPPSSRSEGCDWEYTIERINGLTEKSVLGWMDELIIRGSLNTELKSPEGPDL